MPLHDLRCRRCERVTENVMVKDGNYGRCACGGARTWIPFVPATDVHGAIQSTSILKDIHGRDLTWTSSRERDKKMWERGLRPCGDKEHGARNEDRYKESLFSYDGQRGRKTPTPPFRMRGQ